MILLVFGQTIRHEFICCDDDVYVRGNPYVSQGFTGQSVWWALTASHAGNWHPLTWMSHMLDVECYRVREAGKPDTQWAGGHHLSGVLLHAAGAIVLFLALRQMTGATWLSALVAAMFAIHPLRAESVAWAAERKDVLSGLFWMLSLLAYGWYARKPHFGRYVAVAFFLALGLSAKSMLVSLPFVMLLLDLWPMERWRPSWRLPPAAETPPRFPTRSIGWLVVEKLPLLAIAALVAAWVSFCQRQGGAMSMVNPVSVRHQPGQRAGFLRGVPLENGLAGQYGDLLSACGDTEERQYLVAGLARRGIGNRAVGDHRVGALWTLVVGLIWPWVGFGFWAR